MIFGRQYMVYFAVTGYVSSNGIFLFCMGKWDT